MGCLRGVVFDLDDTLYIEKEYIRSGFQYVARVIAKHSNITSTELFRFMWSLFIDGARDNIFNSLTNTYPTIKKLYSINNLVDLYRNHEPEISLQSGMRELIQIINNQSLFTGIISDGYLKSQRNKVKSLKIENLFDTIILTDIWGRNAWKPNNKAFKCIESESSLSGAELMYIGDNPDKDFLAPNNLGWITVRLKIPVQLRYDTNPEDNSYASQLEVNSVSELTRLISLLE